MKFAGFAVSSPDLSGVLYSMKTRESSRLCKLKKKEVALIVKFSVTPQTFTGVARGGLLVRVRDGTRRLRSAMEQRRHGERGTLQEQRVDEPVVHAEFLPIRGDGE